MSFRAILAVGKLSNCGIVEVLSGAHHDRAGKLRRVYWEKVTGILLPGK